MNTPAGNEHDRRGSPSSTWSSHRHVVRPEAAAEDDMSDACGCLASFTELVISAPELAKKNFSMRRRQLGQLAATLEQVVLVHVDLSVDEARRLAAIACTRRWAWRCC